MILNSVNPIVDKPTGRALRATFVFGCLLLALALFSPEKASAGTIIKAPAYLGLNNGLVGCWSFDGNYTKVPDCSGYGNTGTLTGTTNTVGKVGQALNFNGSSDYVTIANESKFDFSRSQPFTLSAWINVNNKGTKENEIITKAESDFDGYAFFIETDGSIKFVLQGVNNGGSGVIGIATNSTTLAPVGQWTHAIATYDGSSDEAGLSIFINGTRVATTVTHSVNLTGATAILTDENLLIGDDVEADNCCNLGGNIDEARIYNRALSATEISRLYRIGLGSTVNRPTSSLDKGLVGCWTFDGSYTKVPDCSGNNNAGTLTGGPTKKAGKIGQALEFGLSTPKYVNAGFPAVLNDIDVTTICAWIYPRSFGTSGSDATFVSKANPSGPIFQLADDDGTTSLYFVHNFTGDDGKWRAPANTITLNSWQHACVIYDRTSASNTPTFYVDSTIRSTTTVIPPTLVAESDATNNLYIGNLQQDTASSFDGLIDEVRIWNRALSAAEISRLYNSTQSKVNSSKSDVLTNGLVGHWTFDGPDISGTRAKDSSGLGNHGTLTGGPTKVSGKIGQGLSFDGSNDYVDITNQTPFNFEFNQPFTLSAWVYRSRSSGSGNIFGKQDPLNPGGNGFRGYYFASNGTGLCNGSTDNCLEFSLVSNANSNLMVSVQTPADSIQPGRFYHVVVTYNGNHLVSGTKIYINSVSQSLTTLANTLSTNTTVNSVDLNIGVDDTASANYFPGLIDEVRVYNRALSSGEINKLYQMGR